MAYTPQTTLFEHGFDTKWELDKFIFTETNKIATESKNVDGMHDVKWNLECTVGSLFSNFYINLESKTEIKYQIEAKLGKTKDDLNRSANGTVQHRIFQFPNTSLFNPSEKCFENNKLVLNVRARFTYLNQPTKALMNRDASEWGLQLMQKIPCDFTIVVENQKIQISKPFISLESSVFEKMFESNFKEAKENKVTIPDFKYEIVQAAVNYCYAQKILPILDDENKTIDLLYFCDKYDFKTLKPELEEFLASKISTLNVSKFVAVAEKSNSPKLRQTCINFIRSLFNHTPNWDNTKLSDFDADFIKDVLTQSLNITP